ncbi:protein fam65c [Plakobranchus ocellatus]|uniref:Protein fam65c n=1 Tax=Plakobranchus ocellatus TaxID=259542 RepID=A0AAV3XZ91_9GAST|nr:protein fam65c [Plakobranchus ocellatus]
MTRVLYSSGREVEPNINTPSPCTGADTNSHSRSNGSSNNNNNGFTSSDGYPGARHRLFQHPLLPQHSQSLACLPIIEDTNNSEDNANNNISTVNGGGIIHSSQSVSDLNHYQKRNLQNHSLQQQQQQPWHSQHQHHRSNSSSTSRLQPQSYLRLGSEGLSRSSSHLMSIRDSPGRASMPVSRSHSFGGVSVGSASSAGGISGSHSSMSPASIPPVLGGTLRGVPGARQGRSQLVSQYGGIGRSFHRKSPKVPKVPRPARALMVFDSVKRGIGEFIQATHEDIAQLMASETGTSTAQQIKSAERYLKRLEFHLAKIDELHDCYMLQQQLREGARNMARAYNSSSSLSRKDSLANVKYGYKECSQIMCAIEAQLENMLGTFSCRLKGIAGFARLVPGDVFEVVIKHGAQKWKTRGRIEKNNSQRWDVLDYTFKCLVGDTLSIKASEVRAFKTVVLGQKNCEICQPSSHDAPGHGLFSANPQLMTVSINVHGSLKLSIIITWNPLDGMDETAMYFEPPSRPQGSTRRRPFSVAVPNGSLFGSSSDLVAGLGPESRRSIAGPSASYGASGPYVYSGFLQQRDDSGIYGSATSLPSNKMQDSPQQQASPVMQHIRTGGPGVAGNSPGGPPFLTPDLHGVRSRPHTVIALDQQSIRSQPAQASGPGSSAGNERPLSSHIQMEAGVTAATTVSSLSSSSSSSLQAQQLQQYQHTGTIEVIQAQIPGVLTQTAGHEATESGLTVEEALGSLTTTLEDFLGHYPELRALEEIVPKLEALVKKPSAPSSRSSSMSVSIEGAIEEAFDFLNTEDALDEEDEDGAELDEKPEEIKTSSEKKKSNKSTRSDSDAMDSVVSPDSTAKTADSGIESLARRLQEDRGSSVGGGSSLGGSSSSPVPPSSGNEQVDLALVLHLTYCDKLLENLGNYGPLKSREFHSLERLQQQALILQQLVDVAEASPQVDLHAVLSEQAVEKSVRELWVFCVDQTQLYVHPEKVVSVMENKFGPKLQEQFDIRPIRVFHRAMACMLDVPVYSPEVGRSSAVTVYQFANFFKEHGLAKLENIALDLRLMDRLRAGQPDTVIKTILTLREDIPSPPCLKTLSSLLVAGGSTTREMAQSAASYLRVVARDRAKRDQVMVVLVEGLEDHLAEVRAGSCVGLAVIEAEESLKQLVHVNQSDPSSTVRKRAKEALYSLGDAGRKAVEEAQLGTQGFQGLQVRKL